NHEILVRYHHGRGGGRYVHRLDTVRQDRQQEQRASPDDEDDQQRRNDAQDSARVKLDEREPALIEPANNLTADQKAENHEKYIDPDKSSGKSRHAGVKSDNSQDGNRPQAIDEIQPFGKLRGDDGIGAASDLPGERRGGLTAIALHCAFAAMHANAIVSRMASSEYTRP